MGCPFLSFSVTSTMGHVYFQCISVYRSRKSTSVWRRASQLRAETHTQSVAPAVQRGHGPALTVCFHAPAGKGCLFSAGSSIFDPLTLAPKRHIRLNFSPLVKTSCVFSWEKNPVGKDGNQAASQLHSRAEGSIPSHGRRGVTDGDGQSAGPRMGSAKALWPLHY